jgi:hypothetical protein
MIVSSSRINALGSTEFFKRKFALIDISNLSKLHYNLDEVGLNEIALTLTLLGTGAVLNGPV